MPLEYKALGELHGVLILYRFNGIFTAVFDIFPG
jgi:hypothetical protein